MNTESQTTGMKGRRRGEIETREELLTQEESPMTNESEMTASQPAGGVAVEPYIDKPELARRLNKTLRTVDNWMKRGLLPYYKIGRSVSFKYSDVEAHLAQTCRVCRRGGVR